MNYSVLNRLMRWRMIFFFQAEDGIRGLVRSRGLGDVYKRQAFDFSLDRKATCPRIDEFESLAAKQPLAGMPYGPVSYTHLTLPSSDLV